MPWPSCANAWRPTPPSWGGAEWDQFRALDLERLKTALKKLFSPGLEKALVFLDERLVGSTSNAVERGNRRYRKMQKTVYRVRTRQAIEARLALDLVRERRAQGRAETTKTLHKARAA